jgi:hypothetical protein
VHIHVKCISGFLGKDSARQTINQFGTQTLAKLPLRLLTEQSGPRQLLNEAARTASVKLRPRDVDSHALLVALLEREPVCKVQPPSALVASLFRGNCSLIP